MQKNDLESEKRQLQYIKEARLKIKYITIGGIPTMPNDRRKKTREVNHKNIGHPWKALLQRNWSSRIWIP
jgi:hypothetical protein